MSLEQALAANTAALEAMTAALKAGGAKPAAAETKKETPKEEVKKETKAAKGAHTKAEAQALLNEVKEKFDRDVAVEIRNKYAKVEKMADLTDVGDIDALYEACKKKLAEGAAGDDDI